MHVIFDCSHVTVCIVQERCCCQQDSLQAYIGRLLSYLSSVDAPLAVDSLSLTDVDSYARLTVSTNQYHTATFEQVLASKEIVLSIGTVPSQQKGFEQTVVPSASGTTGQMWYVCYTAYCDVFMTIEILKLSHETF